MSGQAGMWLRAHCGAGHGARAWRDASEPAVMRSACDLFRSAMSQASLSSSISTQGFHFTVSTTVSVASWPDAGPCSLHVLHDLDPHVYADQYELAQRPGYSSSLWGTSDLERPVSAVDQTGSILLLSAEPSPFIPGHPANATLEVPLHARYGKPVAGAQDAYHMIELRRPVGFLDCSVDSTVRSFWLGK